MPSKLDLLRNGHAIEFEPGLTGRLNQEKRTLELSNGRVLNVANDRDYFPESPEQLKMSKQREFAEKGAKGAAGQFLHQYTSHGIPHGISDWASYLTQAGDDYVQRNAANAEVSQRISKESPWLSASATGANIATDLALTRGMSALKAAPLLTLGSAGSRIATDPENVALETAFSALSGKLLDAGGNWASKVAARRGASRALPAQQQAVREANELQAQQHSFLKENIKAQNEAQLQKYQSELNARQNKIIENQNDFAQKKAAREAEITRLKNKYEMDKLQRNSSMQQSEATYKAEMEAWKKEEKNLTDQFNLEKKQYEESLKQLPDLQKKAQAEYSQNVVKNAEKIEKSFPKNSKISVKEFDVDGFIDNRLSKSGLTNTQEASKASKILKSLFPEGETLTSREIAGRYKAIEDAIQRASPEVRNILNDFKTHLGEKLPNMLANSMAYERVVPTLSKQLQKDVESIFKKFPKHLTGRSPAEIEKISKESLKNYFDKLTPAEFIEKMKSGQFKQEIIDHLLYEGEKNILNAKGVVIAKKSFPPYLQHIEQNFIGKLDNALAKAELKIIAVETDAAKRLGANVKRTKGMAEAVPVPNAPIAPSPTTPPIRPGELPPVSPINLPPPVTPPVTPPIPAKPQLTSTPSVPAPIAEPTLPTAQGMAEHTGDLLEKNLLGGKGLIDNPFTKLAGLKYLLGSAALPAEAAYLGLNALTSPGAGGQAARLTFKQAGLKAIETWAEKYPSYNNGILENPQDRRSLTKEIEDSRDIPIEQKAILQSKINRGKPLNEKL